MASRRFSWTQVRGRRHRLVERLRDELGFEFPLQAGGTFAIIRFNPPSLATEPLYRVPFYVVAERLQRAAAMKLVIDHAWWLEAGVPPHEPWGFITEPYLNEEVAQNLGAFLGRKYEDWGVTVCVLAKAESAWNPGRCVPIVVLLRSGYLEPFLRRGLTTALALMEAH